MKANSLRSKVDNFIQPHASRPRRQDSETLDPEDIRIPNPSGCLDDRPRPQKGGPVDPNGSCWVPPTAPASEAEIAQAASGANELGFDLFRNLAGEQSGNFFFSGYSIGSALTQVSAGAAGEAAREMSSVLRHTLDSDRLHKAMGGVEKSLLSRVSEDRQISITNRIWTQDGLQIEKPFAQTLRTAYDSEPATRDFKSDPQGAREAINHQVELDTTPTKVDGQPVSFKGGKAYSHDGKEVRGLIQDLIPPDVIDTDTRFVLTNAIYYKDSWASRFDKENTYAEPFRSPTGERDVPTMHQTGEFRYGRVTVNGAEAQVLELPYKGKDMSMVLLLPTEDGHLGVLEQGLRDANLGRWLDPESGYLSAQDVMVSLPKWKMESKFKLKDELQKLGMVKAFSDDPGSFSGITKEEDLKISEVVHQAVIEVNEEGSEMAAATAVVGSRCLSIPRYEEFKADHPFVFVIRDNQTGAVLGAGRCADPNGSGS